MENKETTITISLADLWGIFMRRLVPMIIAGVIAIGALFAYSQLMVTPLYRSTATLYILKTDNNANYAAQNSDFTLALNVVTDCNFIIKSNKVLNAVINELDLSMSAGTLSRRVSTSNPTNTRILQVSVDTEDPNLSKQIVDKICEIGAVEIHDAMNMDQVTLFAYCNIPSSQSNRTRLRTYALAGIGAAAVVYAIYLVMFLLDDKIKTEEDVTKYLSVSVLGEIPNANQSKKKGRYGRYGRYGKYSRYGTYGKYSRYGAYYSSYGNSAYRTRSSSDTSKEGSSEKK